MRKNRFAGLQHWLGCASSPLPALRRKSEHRAQRRKFGRSRREWRECGLCGHHRTASTMWEQIRSSTPMAHQSARSQRIPISFAICDQGRTGSPRLTVLTTGQSTTLQLTAGTQTYLEVEWAPQWNYGYDVGAGFGPTNQAFAVFPVTPQVAQAYLPTLTYRANES